MSVNDSLLQKENREDDQHITQKMQEEDEEPMACERDYHIPKNNKLVIKPAPPKIMPTELASDKLLRRRSTKKAMGTFLSRNSTKNNLLSKDPTNIIVDTSVKDDLSESNMFGSVPNSNPRLIESRSISKI